MSKNIDNRIIEILAKQFILTFEQAKDLYIVYPLTGSDDEGVKVVAEIYGLSEVVVKKVFESLDDLFFNPEYKDDTFRTSDN
ncbi:MAG: hypothetical protein QME51_04035 [Planctomycetota bacterium]|nr:hypothetical protein [Planctomycetota bacterium]